MAITEVSGAWKVVVGRNGYVGSYRFEDHGGRAQARLVAEIAEREAKLNGTDKAKVETCGEFAARYPTDFGKAAGGGPRWNPRVLRNLESILRIFIREHGDLPLAEFGRAEAMAWATEHGDTYRTAVTTMFRDAFFRELIPTNPFDRLNLPRSKGRTNIRAITETELDELIELADEMDGPEWAAFVALCGWAGLRKGEAQALEPRHVDLKRGWLHVHQNVDEKFIVRPAPKNGEWRDIHLPPQAAWRIKALTRNLESRWLLHTADGKPLTHSKINSRWTRLRIAFEARLDPDRAQELRESRVTDRGQQRAFTIHELRHACATIMLRRGAQPLTVMHQCGWADTRIMARYSHVEAEYRVGEAAAVFGANVRELKSVPDQEAANG